MTANNNKNNIYSEKMSEILVIIKSSNADRTEVLAEPTMTVLEFKEKVAEKIPIEPAAQRLIYKGRVLKDECTLKFYDVQDGQTIHLVKGGGNNPSSTPIATPVAAPSSASGTSSFNGMGGFGAGGGGANPNPFQGMGGMGAPGGMPGMPGGMNPEMMSQMMNSPMMESLMSNPDMLRNMIVNNPQMQSMLDSNPQIRHVLNDPAVSLFNIVELSFFLFPLSFCLRL